MSHTDMKGFYIFYIYLSLYIFLEKILEIIDSFEMMRDPEAQFRKMNLSTKS